jgi:hypothetical protein
MFLYKRKKQKAHNIIMDASIHSLTPDHIKEAAKDSHNVVYEWEFDSIDHVKPTNQVRALLDDTIREYLQLRKEHPEWCDKKIKSELVAKDHRFADFKTSHPIYFDKATNRNSNKRDFEVMYFMIDIKARVESGELTHNQATQYIQLYTVKQCSTGKTEAQYKAEQEQQKQNQQNQQNQQQKQKQMLSIQ